MAVKGTTLTIRECVVTGDVFTIDNRRYMFIKPSDPGMFDRDVDELARKRFRDTSPSINGAGNVLVKLPFRYNRYSIHWVDLSSSEDLAAGTRCAIQAELAGFMLYNGNWTPSFKCIRFETLDKPL